MLRRTVTTFSAVPIVSVLKNPDNFVQAGWVGGKPFGSSSSDQHTVLHTCSQRPLGKIPNFTADEVEKAIRAANDAFPSWAALSAMKRSRLLWKYVEVLEKNTDDVAALMSAESGKPFAEAVGEFNYGKSYIEWFAGEAERVYGDIVAHPRGDVRALIRKEPVGVVGVITPWNFPCAMITRAVGGALAAGCTVVVKPSELTPYTATALARLATEAGIPDGVFNVVTGQSSVIGPVLTASKTVRKLSFTGSTAVGVKLYRESAPTVKKLALELGGNAPVIVCADAELNVVIDGIMASKFRNAGQACIAANRIYIPASRHDEMVSALVARIKKDLRVGDGGHAKLETTAKQGATMGPLITPAAAEKVAKMVAQAVEAGATVACGGKFAEGLGKNFYEPTVLTNVKETMDVACGEVFGPVATIIKYDDDKLDDVVRAANAVDAGLAAYVYTTDYRKQWRLSEALEYGMVGVNEGAISAPQMPFGGVKQSGLGRDGSKYGIDQFLETKMVIMGGKI